MSVNHFTEKEQDRTENLLNLIPTDQRGRALDAGARDGHFSKLLARSFDHVVALDLAEPAFEFENVQCIRGNIAHLPFHHSEFDFVLCSEVLEHIPTPLLELACQELARVTKGYLLIGVPYQQDLRVAQTTCGSCGIVNPPWGHIHSFDELKLQSLFSCFEVISISHVAQNHDMTNTLASHLMTLAGNPYGTYDQEESCISCGKKLIPPPKRTFSQKVLAKLSIWLEQIQKLIFLKDPKPQWIHILFKRP